MFQISIPTVIDFDDLRKDIIKANDAAILYAAAKAVTPVRAGMPVRTGEMAREVAVRVFKNKAAGMKFASISVQGKRHFVSVILENGTRDGRIKPRKTFEKLGQQISTQVEQDYTSAFFEALGQ